jgi:hypothetical protein
MLTGARSPGTVHLAVNSPNTATVHERDLDIAAPYAPVVRQQLVARRRGRYSSGYEAMTGGRPFTGRRNEGRSRWGIPATTGATAMRSVAHVGRGKEAKRIAVGWRWSFPPHVGLEQGSSSTSVAPLLGDALQRRSSVVGLEAINGPPLSTPTTAVGLQGRRCRRAWGMSGATNKGRLDAFPDARIRRRHCMNPASGAVKAIVGGFDFAANHNHALQASRQPVRFKPFVYSAASIAASPPQRSSGRAARIRGRKPRNHIPTEKRRLAFQRTPRREALYRSTNLV